MIGRFLEVLFFVLDCPLARLIEPIWILYAIVIHMAIQKALGRFSPLAWTLSRIGEAEGEDDEGEILKLSNRLIFSLLACS